MREFILKLKSDDTYLDRPALTVSNEGYHDAADRPVLRVNGEQVEVDRLRKFCKRVLELTGDTEPSTEETF